MWRSSTSRCGPSGTSGKWSCAVGMQSGGRDGRELIVMAAQAVHVCGRYARCVLARRRTSLALHLLILDTDPDDLIFPRAATRVGPKYQATVPAGPGVADRPKGAYQRSIKLSVLNNLCRY